MNNVIPMSPIPKRKVIQIVLQGSVLIALCHDGTIWNLSGQSWEKVPSIPKD